jgi:hypothetical protein
MPSTSGIAAALTLSRRAQAAAAAIVPMVPVPEAAAVVVRVGAAEPRADLEPDDEGRERLGRRCAAALGERQQRRDDRRHQLALHIGEVEVERVRSDTVGQRSELRRGAQRMPDHRGRGLGALRLHHLAHDLGRLAAASRQHHADGIDESQTGALDRERRDLREIEAGDEIGNQRAEPCGRGFARLRGLRLLSVRAGRCTEQGHCASSEKQSAIEWARPLISYHGRFLRGCGRVWCFSGIE